MLAETRAALLDGADEIDLVIPGVRSRRGRGTRPGAGARLQGVVWDAAAQGDHRIRRAAGARAYPRRLPACHRGGADFIKTSTGKVPVNATPAACRTMLAAIAECGAQHRVGFKAAGGVKSAQEAGSIWPWRYALFGDEWLVAERFRFGASSLLGQLLATIEGKKPVAADGSY